MEAKKILIGIPSGRQDSIFLASLNNLVEQMQGKYQVSVLIEKWQHLPEAQNHITDYFLSRDFDYLLFLDDDHWGHTIEMVDCLVAANADMATIKTYVRHYPYQVAAFVLDGVRDKATKYSSINYQDGYHEVDMTGFPMTLIKPYIFNKLERPYFRGIEHSGRDWHTDADFCERLKAIDRKIVVCYQHCLPHGEVTEENVLSLRARDTVTMKDKVTSFLTLEKQGV